ncbi:hypothetical protein AAMO2058_000179000 [Amorphochlora amoebiformis]
MQGQDDEWENDDMQPSRSNPEPKQQHAARQELQNKTIAGETKDDGAQRVEPPRETFHPTARNQQLQAARTPQAARVSESKLGSETKINPDAKINRIIRGLREMLARFTVSEEMYVDLAVIVGREYRTTAERVQTVQRKLSQWKDAGTLRLHTDA